MALPEMSPTRTVAALRQNKALELRQKGLTFGAIAEELDISPAGAYKCVKRALKLLHAETRDKTAQYVALEISRLDKLYEKAYTAAITGDLNALDRCLKITDTRAKLLGMYAPVKALLDIDVTSLSYDQLKRLAEGKDLDVPVTTG